MGRLDNFLSKFGIGRIKSAGGQYAIPRFNGGVWGLFGGNPAKLTGERAMESYVGWVFACARAIGEEIAKTKFKLYSVDGEQNREEIFEHELLDQLNMPNKFMTGWELKFLLAVAGLSLQKK